MNTYNINDKDFINSSLYDNFMDANPSLGSLEIRAYAASEAIPISGLKIVVSTIYDNNKIFFYDGYTDESGKVPKMFLPAPKLIKDNEEVPSKTVYEIEATYIPDNARQNYKINMYENICVVQNISLVPDMIIRLGDN